MPRKANTTKAEETITAKAPENLPEVETKIETKVEINEESNIYKRLNRVRCDFLNIPLNKSGNNKFAKFKYFELDDIIPVAQPLLEKYGVCFHITFYADHATAQLVNVDDPEDIIEFQTPITELDVRAKGMNSNQALGAVQTYARRRLWIAMLELVENDTLDAISGNPDNVEVDEDDEEDEKPKKASKPVEKDDDEDEPDGFMNIPEDGLGDEVEWLSEKTEKAIKTALKKYRDAGGDETYIKECLMKMKSNNFFEPHGQKLLVEITEKKV